MLLTAEQVQAQGSRQGKRGWAYNTRLGRWRSGSGFVGTIPPGHESEAHRLMPFDESDKALVERVKTGDVRAFEMLHRRYYPRVYRLAYLRLGNAEDAADVASETFRRALQRIDSYQFRRAPTLYPWLHQITSNLIIDHVRRLPAGGMLSLDAQAAEDVDSFLEYLPAEGLNPQELVERGEVQEMVRLAINQLPPDQARAVTLRFLGDQSIREIAQALDRTEGAVKSLLHRALQGLRQHLKTYVAGAQNSTDGAMRVAAPQKAQDNAPEHIHLHRGGA